MKVLYAYNYHRGGNGSLNATAATVRLVREHGAEVREFTRNSKGLPQNLVGRLTAGTHAFYAPEAVREFKRTLDEFRPDVVHAWDVFPLISPWVFRACAERGVPVVMTCDDYFLTCPVRNHFRNGKICTECLGGHEYRAALHNCRGNLTESLIVSAYTTMLRTLRLAADNITRLIVSSEFTRDWMAQHSGFGRERIDLVTHFVDIPPEPADPGAGTYVAFGGRFVPEKGIATFLEASEICGLPFRLSRNKNFFSNVPLPPNADVVVTSGRDDLNAFYRGARIVVSPSIWFETFGLVGAEAMSHGIPLIGSDMGAIQYLIEEGVDGLHFKTGDARDLAEKVRRLWDDVDLLRRMGRNARAKAMSRWTAPVHLEGLLKTYERAIDDVRRAGR